MLSWLVTKLFMKHPACPNAYPRKPHPMMSQIWQIPSIRSDSLPIHLVMWSRDSTYGWHERNSSIPMVTEQDLWATFPQQSLSGGHEKTPMGRLRVG